MTVKLLKISKIRHQCQKFQLQFFLWNLINKDTEGTCQSVRVSVLSGLPENNVADKHFTDKKTKADIFRREPCLIS